MKSRKILLCILTAFLFIGLTLTPAFAANMKAVPSAQKLTINGTVVDNIPVYNINGYNYFKLRDIAYYLDYEVEYLQASNTIAIMRGGHGVNAGISKGKATSIVYGVASSQRVFIDTVDYSSQLHPVNIGGNNYFQLRELAQCAAYGVQFDAASNSILVNSNYSYSKDGLTSQKADGWKETLATSLVNDKEAVAQKAVEAAKTPLNQQQEQKPAEVETVSVTQNSFTLEIGQTAKITASVKPDSAVNKVLTYSSSDTSIATVSADGSVQGKAGGVAKVQVTAHNGKTATVWVYVNGQNQKVLDEIYRLTNLEREKVGAKQLMYQTAAQDFANRRAKEIVSNFSHDGWENGKIYAVGENIVTGGSAEDAINTWMHSPGHKANMLNAKHGAIAVGVYCNRGTYYCVQLFYVNKVNDNTNPQPSSNNQQIGMERVTLIDLNVRKEEMVLNHQETFQLEATTYPLTAMPETVFYSSSDSNVVSVTATGLLIAKNSGKATITASTESGAESTVRIIVPENEPRVAQYSGRTLTYPEVAQIVAETFYSDELATSTALEICTAHKLYVEPGLNYGDRLLPSCQEQNHDKKMTHGDFAWVVYDIARDKGKMLGGGPEYVFAKTLIRDMDKGMSILNFEAASLTYAHGLMDLLGRNGEFKDQSEITEQEVYDVMERLKNKLN